MTGASTGIAVLKFGGSILHDGASVSRACQCVLAEGGERPVVVVSALQGVTDQLLGAYERAVQGQAQQEELRVRHRTVCRQLGLPSDLLDRLWRDLQALLHKVESEARFSEAARDQVLSFGERASARIVAATLREEGILATPVDSFDLGFETHNASGQLRLAPDVSERIRPALQEVPGIPVVTGFLAKDPAGNLTTLGRDGTDWTAAVIARALRAARLVFWKDVPGIMSADPRSFSGGQPIARVSFAEARELAFQGAQVLHTAALQADLAVDTQVWVCHPDGLGSDGTQLTKQEQRNGAVAVAGHSRMLGIAFFEEKPSRCQAKLAAALTALGRAGHLARMVLQSGRGAELWWKEDTRHANPLAGMPPYDELRSDLASVALVGEGLGKHPELFRRAQDALASHSIPVEQAQFGARHHAQTFLIPRSEYGAALNVLHTEVVGMRLTTSLDS